MKQLFVLSLLMNIILFLWEFHQGALNPTISSTEQHSNRQILLLSELPTITEQPNNKKNIQTTLIKPVIEKTPLDSPPQLKVTVESTPSTKKDIPQIQDNSPLLCYQVGQFDSQDKAKYWVKQNKIPGETVHYIEKPTRVISSYLVYYPAGKDYQQSQNNIHLLKSKGISDLWLFRKGTLRGIISLGLFVKQSRALVLQKKLLKQGLTVQVMPRYKEIPSFYVDIMTKEPSFKQHLSQISGQQVKLCPSDN